jgi:hypothetical protein
MELPTLSEDSCYGYFHEFDVETGGIAQIVRQQCQGRDCQNCKNGSPRQSLYEAGNPVCKGGYDPTYLHEASRIRPACLYYASCGARIENAKNLIPPSNLTRPAAPATTTAPATSIYNRVSGPAGQAPVQQRAGGQAIYANRVQQAQQVHQSTPAAPTADGPTYFVRSTINGSIPTEQPTMVMGQKNVGASIPTLLLADEDRDLSPGKRTIIRAIRGGLVGTALQLAEGLSSIAWFQSKKENK